MTTASNPISRQPFGNSGEPRHSYKERDRVRRKEPGTRYVPAGTLGSVNHADDDGWVFIKWNNGFGEGAGDGYTPETATKFLEPVSHAKPSECHRAHPHEDDGCPLNHPQHIEVLRDRARLAREVERLKAEEPKREAPSALCAYCMEKEFFYHIYGVSVARQMLREHHGVCTSNPLVREIATLQKALKELKENQVNDSLALGCALHANEIEKENKAAAEAKLDDIQALVRVEAMGLLTDTRLEDAIQSVLNR